MLNLILLLTFTNINPSITLSVFGKRVVEIDVYESCKARLPAEYINITLRKDTNRRTFINGIIRHHRNISSNTEQFIDVQRCKNKDSPDTCEHFTTLKLSSPCKFNVEKNQLWSPFYDSVHPRLTCPYLKGDHRIVNGWYDGDHTPIPIDRNFYWKVQMRCYEPPSKDMVFCFNAAGRIIPEKN